MSTSQSAVNQGWFQDRLKTLKMSQRQLAKKLGIDPASVSYMLSGKRRMTMEEAKEIAAHLLVSVTEVMRQAGIEVLDDVRKVPIAGYVGQGCVITLLPTGTHDTVVAPADVPVGSFALQTRIVSSPNDGWLYFVSGEQQLPTDVQDRLAVTALKDGTMLCAIVRRGYKQGLFNLVRLCEGGVLENKELAWAARVLWIQPT